MFSFSLYVVMDIIKGSLATWNHGIMSNATVQRIFCGWVIFLATLFNEIDVKPPSRYTLKKCLKDLLKLAMVKQTWL